MILHAPKCPHLKKAFDPKFKLNQYFTQTASQCILLNFLINFLLIIQFILSKLENGWLFWNLIYCLEHSINLNFGQKVHCEHFVMDLSQVYLIIMKNLILILRLPHEVCFVHLFYLWNQKVDFQSCCYSFPFQKVTLGLNFE